MRGFVELFGTSSGDDLRLILDHAAAADLPRLAAVVHRMASAAASLHLTALNERCRVIENLARAEDAAAIAQARDLPELWQRSLKALGEVVE